MPPPTASYIAPPPAGGDTSNGMAVAALVLGIAAVVLFFTCGVGIFAGVLAVIFGFLGLSKAKVLEKGKGMAIAGLVLGAVGIIGGILFIVLVAVGVNNASDNAQDTFGPVSSSDYELTTDTCEIDQYGSVTFNGTIENTANKDLGIDIVGEIRNAKTNALLSTETDYVSTTEGGTSDWSLDTYIDNPVDITCRVTAVNNYLN
jgi:hypothetical protein